MEMQIDANQTTTHKKRPAPKSDGKNGQNAGSVRWRNGKADVRLSLGALDVATSRPGWSLLGPEATERSPAVATPPKMTGKNRISRPAAAQSENVK